MVDSNDNIDIETYDSGAETIVPKWGFIDGIRGNETRATVWRRLRYFTKLKLFPKPIVYGRKGHYKSWWTNSYLLIVSLLRTGMPISKVRKIVETRSMGPEKAIFLADIQYFNSAEPVFLTKEERDILGEANKHYQLLANKIINIDMTSVCVSQEEKEIIVRVVGCHRNVFFNKTLLLLLSRYTTQPDKPSSASTS